MEWKENVEYKNIHNDRLIKITGKIITDVGNIFWCGEGINETPLTSKGKGDIVILGDGDLQHWMYFYRYKDNQDTYADDGLRGRDSKD